MSCNCIFANSQFMSLNFTANETANIPSYHYRPTDPSLRAISKDQEKINMRETLKQFGILVIRKIRGCAKCFGAFDMSRSNVDRSSRSDKQNKYIYTPSSTATCLV